MFRALVSTVRHQRTVRRPRAAEEALASDLSRGEIGRCEYAVLLRALRREVIRASVAPGRRRS